MLVWRVAMKYAVTGTPGVGKTSASALVRAVKVVHVNDIVDGCGAVVGFDDERGTKEVDVKKLARHVAKMKGDVLLEGHFSHLLGVDVAVVLRCSPKVLRGRLAKKGWPEAKVRENVEAEAVDVILVEAVEEVPEVCEMDTTGMTSVEVAAAIEEIVAGEIEKYPVGNVDWSREVLDWF
jgi:adenylate kinase